MKIKIGDTTLHLSKPRFYLEIKRNGEVEYHLYYDTYIVTLISKNNKFIDYRIEILLP